MVLPSHGPRWSSCLSTAVLLFAGLGSASAAEPPSTEVAPGLRVVRNVRLDVDEGAPRVSLVLRNGRIEAVLGPDDESPAGALETDGEGALVVPAFIDAFSQVGFELPDPTTDLDRPVSTRSDVRVDMRTANRKGLRPALRAALLLTLTEADTKALRAAGFGATLVAPTGELLSGSSALLVTRDAATREALLVADVFDHATFSAQGGGFPSTLMGYLSQLRQFFLDARHHALLHERYAASTSDPRPPVDADLEAILPVLDGTRVLVCRADNARDIERWLALGDEVGFQPAISGGREAWKLADKLAERGVPVILTLDWGDEVDDPAESEPASEDEGDAPEPSEDPDDDPDEQTAEVEDEPDWIYTEPLGVRTERRRLWEQGRDCALRLNEAGVTFAFGSGGDSADDLLEHVRELVEVGLPREVALAGLTDGAARLLGVEQHLGTLAVGRDATFGLWTDDPLAEDAKLAWLFVDGHPHEFDLKETDREPPDEGLDASGTWNFEFEDEDGTEPAVVVLEMNAEGDLSGTLTRANPLGEGDVEIEVEGFLSAAELSLEGTLTLGDMQIELEIVGTLTEDTFEGETTVRGPWGEDVRPTEATRAPEARTEAAR